MTDFLLELRCEEIPARMQAGARAELQKLFAREMEAAGVTYGDVTIWSTPRRLALVARDLPPATKAVSEEHKGPPEGAPDKAVDGFCRKLNIAREQLEVREVKGRATYFAVIDTPGRATGDVLANAVPTIVRAFSWPKSQRWGSASVSTESLRWVRPLSGIVALFGGELIECSVGEIAAGRATMGHRFHSKGSIEIASAGDYADALRAAHVLVNHQERATIIRDGAAKAASDAGLTLIVDEGLVVENAGLTEWPVPLLGRFDEAFLDVPPEVIQLTARVNQKYFVCEDAQGKLANAFVCTANIDARDGGAAIVEGNQKVLAARLSDAKFFWELDQKTCLADHAKKLERITFHEKLGTVADKVERVAKLAEWLASEGIVPNCDPALARQAAELCKADLVTEMVGEFPELQGLMGGYYARAEGLPDAVADAIRDHYKPIGQGADVPTAPVTVAVSLADKLDTLASFFAIDEKPTGSKDPFALRRAAIGVLLLLNVNNLSTSMRLAFTAALEDNYIGRIGYNRAESPDVGHPKLTDALLDFFADRLKVQQKEAGVRHDLIDAVFALGGEDDLVRLLARVKALQAFVETEDGANLLAGYKRAANILKKKGFETPVMSSAAEQGAVQTGEEDPLAGVEDPAIAKAVAEMAMHPQSSPLNYDAEPAEAALIDALNAAEPRAAKAIEEEDFEGAMAALASLRGPIDSFFDSVIVNDPDGTKRDARLSLLERIRAAVHNVADFSKIEG